MSPTLTIGTRVTFHDDSDLACGTGTEGPAEGVVTRVSNDGQGADWITVLLDNGATREGYAGVFEPVGTACTDDISDLDTVECDLSGVPN